MHKLPGRTGLYKGAAQAASRTVRVWLAGLLMAGCFFPGFAFGEALQFKDMVHSYAKKEVQALTEAGVISGFADQTFRPHETVTRAELAKLLALSLELKEDAHGAFAFEDVEETNWYRGYIGALVEAGIASGVSPVRYAPDAPVLREELVVFFIRAFGLEGAAMQAAASADGESAFADYGDVSAWARAHVALAHRIGFVHGMKAEDGSLFFGPKLPTDRQAAARLAYELVVHKSVYMDKAAALVQHESDSVSDSIAPEAISIEAIQSIEAIDATTVEVMFSLPVEAVDPADFAFDHGLLVMSAVFKENNPSVVVLKTSEQTPGVLYTLGYRGQDTGKTVVGRSIADGSEDDADASENSRNNGGLSAAQKAAKIQQLLEAGGDIYGNLTIALSLDVRPGQRRSSHSWSADA